MWSLAIDFGTSFSTAAIVADGRVTVVDVFGQRRLPSVVLREEDGQLVVGSAAENAAVFMADRVERNIKRAVGTRMILLGGEPVLVVDIVAAILAVLVDEAVRQRGGDAPDRVVLTHPARWSEQRLSSLRESAVKAGIDTATLHLVAEPVAAAALYSRMRSLHGDAVVVYDLGGGTFDTAVLRHTGSNFEVIGPPNGDERIGGEAFDHLLYRKVGEHLAAQDAALWVDLTASPERRWRRANADLLHQVQIAKEVLSTTQRADVYVPVADRVVSVTRSEFEALVADDIQRSIEILAATLSDARVQPGDVAAVYLAGGSSRIPMVGRRLTESYGNRIATWDDPQLAVVLGAAELLRDDTTLTATQLPPAPPLSPPPPPPSPVEVHARRDPHVPAPDLEPQPAQVAAPVEVHALRELRVHDPEPDSITEGQGLVDPAVAAPPDPMSSPSVDHDASLIDGAVDDAARTAPRFAVSRALIVVLGVIALLLGSILVVATVIGGEDDDAGSGTSGSVVEPAPTATTGGEDDDAGSGTSGSVVEPAPTVTTGGQEGEPPALVLDPDINPKTLGVEAFSDLELVETEEAAVQDAVDALPVDADRILLDYDGACGNASTTEIFGDIRDAAIRQDDNFQGVVVEVCTKQDEEVENGVVYLVGDPRRFDLALLVAHELVPLASPAPGVAQSPALVDRYVVVDGYVRDGETGDLDHPWT